MLRPRKDAPEAHAGSRSLPISPALDRPAPSLVCAIGMFALLWGACVVRADDPAVRLLPAQDSGPAKPAETRMGSGKGAVDHWVAVIKPGRVIFEIGGVSHEIAKEAARLASHKLPVKTRFIVRGEAENVEA